MPATVLIVDDHTLFREGLRNLLSAQTDFTVAGEASDGRSGVDRFRELSPDVVIMDVAMPDLNGVDATRQILAIDARAKVIGLSMHTDGRFVKRMLQAGASGYVLKDCAFEELALALKTVLAERIYLSPGVTSEHLRDYAYYVAATQVPDTTILTPREREVLQLLAEGRNAKQTAESLGISVKTVDAHRAQIKEKLDLRTVAELTKYAVREGLTDL